MQTKIYLNKSFITNFISIIIILMSWAFPQCSKQFINTGLFALSGSITNWLAIKMLFDKIPFLYGSGVIPNKFKEFKAGIKELISEEFFKKENLIKFLSEENDPSKFIDLIEKIIDDLNYDSIFEDLVKVIMNSSFGGMLTMMGGAEALTPLKEPFKVRIKDTLRNILRSPKLKEKLKENLHVETMVDDLSIKINQVIESRLKELTPLMVKEIIQNMIRKHLGWLVVWGGVFGGLIGLVFSFVSI